MRQNSLAASSFSHDIVLFRNPQLAVTFFEVVAQLFLPFRREGKERKKGVFLSFLSSVCNKIMSWKESHHYPSYEIWVWIGVLRYLGLSQIGWWMALWRETSIKKRPRVKTCTGLLHLLRVQKLLELFVGVKAFELVWWNFQGGGVGGAGWYATGERRHKTMAIEASCPAVTLYFGSPTKYSQVE